MTFNIKWWWSTDTAVLNLKLLPRVYYTRRVQDDTKQSYYWSMDQTSLNPEFTKKFAKPPKGMSWYRRITIEL